MPSSTNRTHVERVMTLLASGLRPFVERRLLAVDGAGWLAKAQATIAERRELAPDDLSDVSRLCGLLLARWRDAFDDLGNDTRALVFEIRDARNRWAHQRSFADRDVLRLVDSAQRLLAAVRAPEAEALEAMHEELRGSGSGKRLAVTVAIAAAIVAVVVGLVRLQDDRSSEPAAPEPAAVATIPDPAADSAPETAALAARPVAPVPDSDRLTVCGRVVRTHWARESRGAPTFVNVEDARSLEEIAVVIWEDDREAFAAALGDAPESAYRGTSVCATGKPGEHQGRPQLEVSAPPDIVVTATAPRAITATEETCGDVVRTHWAKDSKGRPAFITLGVEGRDEPVTLVIWEQLRDPFLARFGRNPEDVEDGTRICVAAPVETYQGRRELAPTSIDAIRLPAPER
jgi:hypothetical protein